MRSPPSQTVVPRKEPLLVGRGRGHPPIKGREGFEKGSLEADADQVSFGAELVQLPVDGRPCVGVQVGQRRAVHHAHELVGRESADDWRQLGQEVAGSHVRGSAPWRSRAVTATVAASGPRTSVPYW